MKSIFQNCYMDHVQGLWFIAGCTGFVLAAAAAAIAFAMFLPAQCNLAFCV
jgi:hypothetical protein